MELTAFSEISSKGNLSRYTQIVDNLLLRIAVLFEFPLVIFRDFRLNAYGSHFLNSAILGFPKLFQEISVPFQKFRNFFSNGKHPRFFFPFFVNYRDEIIK